MSLDDLFYLNTNDDNIDAILHIGRYKVAFHSDVNQSFINTSSPVLPDECDIAKLGSLENVAYFCFMLLILLTSIIGNSLVVMASVLSKQLRHRVTVYFIISLAISDLAFAVSLIPFNISMKTYSRFCHNRASCHWMIASDAFCNVASILNLFLIAIDRFVAITMPFRYSYVLTVNRAKKLIAAVWIFSAIWSFVGFFKWNNDESNTNDSVLSVQLTSFCLNKNYYYYAASYFGIYLLPLLIMSVTYLIILQVALTQIQAIESTHVELQSSTSTIDVCSTEELRHRQMTNDIERHKKAQQRKRRKELRATKSVAIVYFAFLLCWFPNCVINLIIMFNSSYFPELKKTNETLFLFIYYCFIQILPMVNTMINPVIYSFSNKQFRTGFRSVYRRVLTKLESPESSYESSRRDTRALSLAHPMSPTSMSSSSQSSQSLNSSRFRFKWSPMFSRKISDQNNASGAFHNDSVEIESLNNSKRNSTILWKSS